MFYFNLFKQDEATGNQPIYKNNKVTVDEDIVIKAGQVYSVALWKKDQTKDGKPVNMLSVKVEENNFDVSNITEEQPKADLPNDDIVF